MLVDNAACHPVAQGLIRGYASILWCEIFSSHLCGLYFSHFVGFIFSCVSFLFPYGRAFLVQPPTRPGKKKLKKKKQKQPQNPTLKLH